MKRLSGLVSRGVNTRSTAEYQEPGAADEKKNEHMEELASKNDTNTRSGRKQELVSKKENETVVPTRNDKSDELEITGGNETADHTSNTKPLELAGSDVTAKSVNTVVNHALRGTHGSGINSEVKGETTTRARARLTSPAELTNNWKKIL